MKIEQLEKAQWVETCIYFNGESKIVWIPVLENNPNIEGDQSGQEKAR